MGPGGVTAAGVGAWRFAWASVAGTAHLREGRPCQDVGRCTVVAPASDAPALTACGADGAGSAARGDEGARLACASFVDAVEELYASGRRPDAADGADREREVWWSGVVADWLARFQAEVEQQAERVGGGGREFACTFLGALIEEGWAALVQIGDGAIVVDDGEAPGGYALFVWPQRGEYANETYFATDRRSAEHVALGVVSRRVEEIALLTDGLQGLVLDYARRTAHDPFFRRMFAPVRSGSPGECGALSAALATFLCSRRVRARTDDDTTLILATRRTSPCDPAGEPDGAGL
jgi:hypothetical protein